LVLESRQFRHAGVLEVLAPHWFERDSRRIEVSSGHFKSRWNVKYCKSPARDQERADDSLDEEQEQVQEEQAQPRIAVER